MRQDDERAALIALLRATTRWRDVTEHVADRGSALAVLHWWLGQDDSLFPDAARIDGALTSAGEELERWRSRGIGVHAFFDDGYPEQLRDIREMPPVLFSRGALVPEQGAVAVVGTRRASERGLAVATTVARSLAAHGVTVVSGLAAGIDTAAHRAALASGARTVAVIGTGVERDYPRDNAKLQETIAERGLLLSQFWPDAAPTKQSFPMRNAVMSGYAAATIVIEAGWKSGARIQARKALQHGRPVILPEETLAHDWARQISERPGVFVVRDPDDLLRVVDELIADMNLALDDIPEINPLAWT